MKMILWWSMAALMVAASIPAWAQQPKFEIADVHNSTTLRQFAVSVGPVLLDGRYIYRDATMLDLIKNAYWVTVFEAMERELGLRLVKQKRAIAVIMMDHVDEKPIE